MIDSMVLVGSILIILGTAMGFTNYLVDEQVPMTILATMQQYIHDPLTFLMVLNVFLLIVGCMMDIFSAIIVVVPLIIPIAQSFDVNMVHLGIIFLTNLEIGYSTPPVGINLFIAATRFNKPVLKLYQAVLPFLGLRLVGLILITYVPAISLFLVDWVYTVFKNPIGLTGLAATQKGLIRLANKVPSEKAFETLLVKNLGFQIQKNPKHFDSLVEQFQKYFKGELESFQFPLDLRLGTKFQQKVWKGLLTIPYGSTHSYKWLAKTIKNPDSARAVGNANGQNPLSIIIPCHRVVRENGDLGGYTGGIKTKRYLLELEKAI